MRVRRMGCAQRALRGGPQAGLPLSGLLPEGRRVAVHSPLRWPDAGWWSLAGEPASLWVARAGLWAPPGHFGAWLRPPMKQLSFPRARGARFRPFWGRVFAEVPGPGPGGRNLESRMPNEPLSSLVAHTISYDRIEVLIPAPHGPPTTLAYGAEGHVTSDMGRSPWL